ncbi:MAG: hypothetical protein ABIP97_07995 [Chthoniobacterales bacterium]
MSTCKKCGTEYLALFSTGLCKTRTLANEAAYLERITRLIEANKAGNTPEQSLKANVFIRRYQDAYAVAHSLAVWGSVVKMLALITGAVILGMSYTMSARALIVFLFSGLYWAILVGLLLYVFGVFISTRSHAMMAALDQAVNTSPFLSDVERLEAMGL